MNEALIQNSKNDVDHQNRRQQQQAHAGERVLESLSRTLERALDISGEYSIGLALDQFCRVPQSCSGLEVEADGCRRQLAQVIHREGTDGRYQLRDGVERDHFPSAGADVEKGKLVRIVLEFGQHFYDDVVLVVGCVYCADLAGTVSGV